MTVFTVIIFNVAKRARVTVEAMETKGFSQSLDDSTSRELRTDGMMVRPRDVSFVFGSLPFVAALWAFLYVHSLFACHIPFR